MARVYSTTDPLEFDRDGRELAAQGWEVVEITQRQQKQGCVPWLTWGTMFIQPPLELVVTYRRRKP